MEMLPRVFRNEGPGFWGLPVIPLAAPVPPCTPSIKHGSDSNETFLEGLRTLLSKANCKLTVCSEQDTRSDRWIQVGTPGHRSITAWLGQHLERQRMEQGTGTEAQGTLSGVARTGTMPGEPGLAPRTLGDTGTGSSSGQGPRGAGQEGPIARGTPVREGRTLGGHCMGDPIAKGTGGTLPFAEGSLWCLGRGTHGTPRE